MTKRNFLFTDKLPSSTEAFAEASESELKVLVALMEQGGAVSDEKLLEVTGVSKARLAAAIALWLGEGVIKETDTPPVEAVKTPYGNRITEEFEERVGTDELYEESASEVAENIRSNRLASLMDEVAAMMGKPMLSPSEVKRIAGLAVQYALSEEYIAILASHLATKDILTVTRLVSRAIKLTERDINTAEELEAYLVAAERERGDFAMLKRLFGINDRRLSRTEENYFRKWLYDYGYGLEILTEAYDFTVNSTGKRTFAYMDKILTDWNDAGCRTVAACIDRHEQVRAAQNAEAAEKKKVTVGASKRPEKEKPRYTDVDPMEAFKRALERSFPQDKKED